MFINYHSGRLTNIKILDVLKKSINRELKNTSDIEFSQLYLRDYVNVTFLSCSMSLISWYDSLKEYTI